MNAANASMNDVVWKGTSPGNFPPADVLLPPHYRQHLLPLATVLALANASVSINADLPFHGFFSGESSKSSRLAR